METQTPPHHVEAERAVLSALMLENAAIGDVLSTLWADDFYVGAHRDIYRAIEELYKNSSAVDGITLTQHLVVHGNLNRVGGQEYLVDLSDAAPSAANVKHYVEIVKDKARLRRVLAYTREIQSRAHKPEARGKDIEDQFQRAAFLIETARPRQSGLEQLGNILPRAIANLQKSRDAIVPTGLHELDNIVTGFEPGDFVVVGARPSMGKTALALNILRNASRHIPCAMFSLEMGAEQLAQRVLASAAHVNLHRIRCGSCSDFDLQRINEKAGDMEGLPIYIDDSAAVTVSQIKTKVRALAIKTKQEIGLVCVDYLQLMDAEGKHQNDNSRMASISRGLKLIAKELKTRVLALSQLSREIDRRPALHKEVHLRKPTAKDFRDSGAIEQDADVALGIYRPEQYEEFKDDPKWSGVAQVIVIKHRNGPIGTADLFWDAPTATFRDPAPSGLVEP